MLVAKLRQLMADVFDLDEGEMPEEPTRENIEVWDSLNHLRLVTALEEEFGIKLQMHEVEAMDGISRLAEIVQAHTDSQ